LGIVTPGRIGEALKIPWLKKHGLPLKTSIALTIADRLLDITTLFVLSIGALGILFDWKYAVAGLCVLLIATVLFCVRTHRIEHAWAQWKKPIMITILNWTIYFLQMVFLARAFNLVIPMPAFLASMTIAGVLSMLPIAPAGLGTRDAVLVLLFTQFSIVPAQTIAFSFSLFVLMLCASLIGAYFWLWSPYIRH
ncbi:MAG: lysylphosphatidylglycerol synthase domain-containing protein, partial [Candidatus Peribacteraceae bacterium]